MKGLSLAASLWLTAIIGMLIGGGQGITSLVILIILVMGYLVFTLKIQN